MRGGLRRRGGSRVAHLTSNQLSRVRIRLLPRTWQTLSVLRQVATWDGRVPYACLWGGGGRGTQYTQKTKKYTGKKIIEITASRKAGSECMDIVSVGKKRQGLEKMDE
jgi:hypothetical protein